MTPTEQQRCRESLLPCPFCGHPPISQKDGEKHGWLIECSQPLCTCAVRVWAEAETEEAAIAAWNTRAWQAQEECMRKLVEALAIAKAFTAKYLHRVNFEGLDDRQISELREVHYQAKAALAAMQDYAGTATASLNTEAGSGAATPVPAPSCEEICARLEALTSTEPAIGVERLFHDAAVGKCIASVKAAFAEKQPKQGEAP